MSRQQRRAQERKAAKLSRNATDHEIFPGGHGPVQPEATKAMHAIMKVLQDFVGPNYDITLFLAERSVTAGREAPRFNYMSTADRRDMYAVLRAFLKKNEALGATLDKIEDAPPTESKQ